MSGANPRSRRYMSSQGAFRAVAFGRQRMGRPIFPTGEFSPERGENFALSNPIPPRDEGAALLSIRTLTRDLIHVWVGPIVYAATMDAAISSSATRTLVSSPRSLAYIRSRGHLGRQICDRCPPPAKSSFRPYNPNFTCFGGSRRRPVILKWRYAWRHSPAGSCPPLKTQ